MTSARVRTPWMLVRGRSTSISVPIYGATALTHATGGAYAIYDASGVSVASGSLSIVSHVATMTVTLPSTVLYGEEYRAVLEITHAGGSVYVENEVYVVRFAPTPSITYSDLYSLEPRLNPDLGAAGWTVAGSYEDQIETAWVMVQNKLIARGNRPHLILGASALNQVHLYLSLHLIFVGLSHLDNADLQAKADHYWARWESEWGSLTFREDTTGEGTLTATAGRRGQPSIFLTSRR